MEGEMKVYARSVSVPVGLESLEAVATHICIEPESRREADRDVRQ